MLAWWLSSLLERRCAASDPQPQSRRQQRQHLCLGAAAAYLVWIIGTLIGLNLLGFHGLSFRPGRRRDRCRYQPRLQNIVGSFVSGIIPPAGKRSRSAISSTSESGCAVRRDRAALPGSRQRRCRRSRSQLEFINPPRRQLDLQPASAACASPSASCRLGQDRRPRGRSTRRQKVQMHLRDESHKCDVWPVSMGESRSTSRWPCGSAPATSPASQRRNALPWAIHDELIAAAEIPFRNAYMSAPARSMRCPDRPRTTTGPVRAGRVKIRASAKTPQEPRMPETVCRLYGIKSATHHEGDGVPRRRRAPPEFIDYKGRCRSSPPSRLVPPRTAGEATQRAA